MNSVKDIAVHLETDSCDWDRCVRSSPQASMLHLFGWKDLMECHFGHQSYFLSARKSNDIVAVLPLVLISNRFLGTKLCSLPFVDFGGVNNQDRNSADVLLTHASRLADQHGADHLEIRSRNDLDVNWTSHKFKVLLTLDLEGGHERIWSGYKGKHRTAIRRTYKNNLTVKQGRLELLDDFYTVLAASWHSLGSPFYSKSFFEELLRIFPDNAKIFVVYDHSSQAICASLNGYLMNRVDGLWAGMVPSARGLQPNYVLYWEMIKDACDGGFTEFSMGRSTAGSQAETFKKKWGAQVDALNWIYYMPKGRLAPVPTSQNKWLRLAANVWKKLPYGIVNTLGPHLAKHLP